MAITKKQYKVTLKAERYSSGMAIKPDRQTEDEFSFTNSNIGEDSWSEISLATGQNDVALPLAGVSMIKFILLYSDVQIKVKVNSNDVGNVAIPLRRLHIENVDGGLTAIYLTNDSGNTANIKYVIAEEAPAS